jgi:8-hydroxy-5-deazaflavin:NADPH oxidoreductase
MTNVTIFGSGNMGAVIESVLAAGGASVDHITSSDYWKEVNGELVILAVYHPALKDILSRYADDFAGKIVVDITNPVDTETYDGLVVPAGSSSAAELADQLPSSRVLKAFNTNFAATLADKSVGPNKTTVLVAGDDDGAKATLIDALVAGGVGAIDAGNLKRAHELEALGFLQISLAASNKISWTGGFALVE